MEKNKKNISLIVIILVIIILLLVGFITFNKLSSNKSNGNGNDKGTLERFDYEEIARAKAPSVLSLVNQNLGSYTYCGEMDKEDLIENNSISYVASTRFIDEDEVRKYLKTVVTEGFLDQYFKYDSSAYMKQGDILYCSYSPSDGFYTNFMTESDIDMLSDLRYDIANMESDKFGVVISFKYESEVDPELNGEYTATLSFIKQKGEWLVNDYVSDFS